MKVQIIRDLNMDGDKVYFFAWQMDDSGKRIYCICCSETMPGLEKKLEDYKRKKDFKPELIKEIEL
jgi:hypothetical protein